MCEQSGVALASVDAANSAWRAIEKFRLGLRSAFARSLPALFNASVVWGRDSASESAHTDSALLLLEALNCKGSEQSADANAGANALLAMSNRC